jgi:septin family protein
LSGRNVDTRKPDELHRTTLEKALARAAAIAQKQGAPLSDPARDAVRRTLAVLPTDEPPGRLTREPPAVGFSLLTGIKPRVIDAKTHRKTSPEAPPAGPTPEQLRLLKIAAKREKAAQAKARKEEEKARREREKRERAIQNAEQALRDAERRLAELKNA